MDERLYMRCETNKADTIAKLNELFRDRTQQKELLEETEVQIQVGRGRMLTLEWVQGQIKEINQEDKLDETKRKREGEQAGILNKVSQSDIEFLAERVAEELGKRKIAQRKKKSE